MSERSDSAHALTYDLLAAMAHGDTRAYTDTLQSLMGLGGLPAVYAPLYGCCSVLFDHAATTVPPAIPTVADFYGAEGGATVASTAMRLLRQLEDHCAVAELFADDEPVDVDSDAYVLSLLALTLASGLRPEPDGDLSGALTLCSAVLLRAA